MTGGSGVYQPCCAALGLSIREAPTASAFVAGWGKGKYSKRACLYSPLRPLFFYNHRLLYPQILKILT